jgi:catechol 2,3-dioxygenase-like lactoylglutathione lyase family enzyme
VLVGIDHVAIAVADLDAATAELRDRLGIEAGGGGVHPGAGTANRLAWFGDTYLELIAVVDRVAAGASFLGEPTIRVLDEGGAGLVTFVLASDDLDADVARLRSAGSTMGDPFAGERRRADGRVVRWRLARAGAVGPAEPPFLIEHDVTAAEWTPPERAARGAETHPLGGTVRLTALELVVPDPVAMAEAYREAVGLGREDIASRQDTETVAMTVGGQRVVLRPTDPGRGAAAGRDRRGPPATIRLAATGGSSVTADLFGCRFVVEAVDPPSHL